MIVVGVDPGKKGYACSWDQERSLVSLAFSFYPAPVIDGDYDVRLLVDLCDRWYFVAELVVLERQAPQRHGIGKFGLGREGTRSSWTNGYGFGLWKAALVATGFREMASRETMSENGKYFIVVEPLAWKRRLGVLVPHRGEGSRRKAADARSIEVSQQVAPGVDLRPLERSPGARVSSPDKACALLLAKYGRVMLSER